MTLRLWNLDTGRELARFEGHTEPVWAIDVSRDGRMAVSASTDGTVRLWGLAHPGDAPKGVAASSAGTPDPVRRIGRIVYDFTPQAPRCLALRACFKSPTPMR